MKKWLVCMFMASIGISIFLPTTVIEGKQDATPPRIIKTVAPAYPPDAIRRRAVGWVRLKAIVTKEGNVRDPVVEKSSPPGVFDKSALETVVKWKFKPATKNGKPVDIKMIIPLSFNFNQKQVPYNDYSSVEKNLEHLKNGDYDMAINAFTEGINGIYSKNATAYYARGLAHKNLKEYEEAISNFNKAIKLKKKHPLAYFERGDIFDVQKKFEMAIADYSKTIKYKPDFLGAYYQRGIACLKNGNPQQGVKDFSHLIKMKPSVADTYVYRGLAYADMQEKDRTCADLRKACDLGKCDVLHIYKGKGWCH